MHLETKTEWRSPAYCGYTSQPSVAIASVLPLQNYTFSGVQPNLRPLSPPASPSSLHLILSYQLHMSTHGHKAMPVLPRFGWAKTVETPPVSRVFLPKTIETPPASRVFLPKTVETPPASRMFLSKTVETPPVSRTFLPKTVETPPVSRVFLPKTVETPPVSRVFLPKTSDCHLPNRGLRPIGIRIKFGMTHNSLK